MLLGIKGSRINSKDSYRTRALNECEVGKNDVFREISRRISETVQDRTKVAVDH